MNVTPPSKRPRGRPRKTAVTSPIIAQLAVKPPNEPVPSSILSPPSSVSSSSQTNIVHQNSTSPLTHHSNPNLRYINDNVLTPPILSSTTDTNVIARVPSLFDQVKTTTNESTFAVLSGVQNVLLSPNRDSNNNNKRVRVESSSSSVVSTTNIAGKQVENELLLFDWQLYVLFLGEIKCQCFEARFCSFTSCYTKALFIIFNDFKSN